MDSFRSTKANSVLTRVLLLVVVLLGPLRTNLFVAMGNAFQDCGHVTEMTIAVTTAMKTLSIAQLTHASPANTGVAMVAVSSALGSVTMKTTAAMAPTS